MSKMLYKTSRLRGHPRLYIISKRHMDIARTEADKFMGREDELFRVKEYLLSSRKGAFVVYGPTGSGKTCFISKVATLTGWSWSECGK